MERPLYIVACSQTKSPQLCAGERMPARLAYTGQAFKLARTRLEAASAQWCILSGFYGFLWPTTLIDHYDAKMEPVSADTVWDNCFGHITNRQYAKLMTARRVIVVGSALYCNAASVLLKRNAESPFRGLPIGLLLQQIKSGAWLAP